MRYEVRNDDNDNDSDQRAGNRPCQAPGGDARQGDNGQGAQVESLRDDAYAGLHIVLAFSYPCQRLGAVEALFAEGADSRRPDLEDRVVHRGQRG